MTTRLIFKTQGIPKGEHLLVLHGWGMNSSVWKTIAADLEQQFQVTWLDLPGHGDNHQIQAQNLAQIVAIILPFLKQPTHLMGWSLGGLVAQEIVRQRPDLIKRIVLVATTPRFSQTRQWNNAMPNDLLAAFSESLVNDTQGTLKRFIALQFMGVSGSQTLQRQLKTAILNDLPNKMALRVGLNILQKQDFISLNMTQKQLWILGEKDRLIPVAIKKELHCLYPSADIEVIKKAGHAPFMTHPQSFIKYVLRFLNRKNQ